MSGLRLSALALWAAAGLAALAGCAAPSLRPDVAASLQPLRTERIAVSYDLVQKRIHYSEVLFRGLFLTTNTSIQDFSGIWPADQDLTNGVVHRLNAQSLHADSVYDQVDRSSIAAANAVLSSHAIEQAVDKNPEVFLVPAPNTRQLPLKHFFQAYPEDPEFAALSEALQAKGFRYLLQMTAMDLEGMAPGYGMVSIKTAPNARVLDLKDRKVLWTRYLLQTDIFQLGGDLKKLEIDNMAKTKEGLTNGINKVDFVDLWELK